MKRLRVAVVTGTRAEWGLLAPVVARLRKDRRFDCRLVVTGAHLDRARGYTVREILAEKVRVDAKVPLEQRGDDGLAVAVATGNGVIGLSRAYARLKPDLVMVLGDRFEAFAAAAAALPLRIPVAHLHGGERTEGVWDESLRHAITKLSHLHFAAAPEYGRRLKRLGEDPRRVFVVGSPAVDRLRSMKRLSRAELAKDLRLELRAPVIVATFHPETLAKDRGLASCRAMIRALEGVRATVVVTAPNADAGGKSLRAELARYVARSRGSAVLRDSLGSKRYYSLLAHADAMVGNSSSGILEAPYFGLPVVNVGSRQQGRERLGAVIEVPRASPEAVRRALERALSEKGRAEARRRTPKAASPSALIASALKKVRFDDSLLVKRFHD